jgi:hypothetical protein
MIREEYFKKLEAKYVKYWYVAQEGAPDVVELAREIAKYTDEEKKVTRIVNGLRRGNVHSIEDLMRADINELAKARNIGHDALNILRQIKGLPTTTYADEHPFSKKKTKDKIIEQLEKLGYLYSTKLWDDGTVMTYLFKRPDCMRDDCYWEVAIEDHTDDDGEDWLIFVRYHDPDQKEWDGHQIDISGCVEFEAMKLIVEFAEILKKEEK